MSNLIIDSYKSVNLCLGMRVIDNHPSLFAVSVTHTHEALSHFSLYLPLAMVDAENLDRSVCGEM